MSDAWQVSPRRETKDEENRYTYISMQHSHELAEKEPIYDLVILQNHTKYIDIFHTPSRVVSLTSCWTVKLCLYGNGSMQLAV